MATPSAEVLEQLRERAHHVRVDVVRMIGHCSGHAGGALSAVETVTALYFHQMNYDPADPSWPERDRFVLSKGHAAPVLYAALAEAGYFDRERLLSLRRFRSCLQGHPDMRSDPTIPGIEISTGELGQGLSAGCGMALASRMTETPYRVYVLLGDGEIQEGQIWEAAMFAAHYRLGNLTAIVDYNGLQIDGPVRDIMNLEPVADKWRAFGWQVEEVDGHDFAELLPALETAAQPSDQPTMIVAHTVKGKGVAMWENEVASHHIHEVEPEDLSQALHDLGVNQ